MTEWGERDWALAVDRILGDARYVNLGVGLPTRLLDHLDTTARMYQCENGIVGMGSSTTNQDSVAELLNASSRRVTLAPGAAVVDLDVSFGLMRGGHLDATVLGAFEVSVGGDFASWSHPSAPVPGVGGAMDLAAGTHGMTVMMHHTNRDGSPRLVERLQYPHTGRGCVRHIVTEHALLQVGEHDFTVLELAPGMTPDALTRITAAPLTFVGATASTG